MSLWGILYSNNYSDKIPGKIKEEEFIRLQYTITLFLWTWDDAENHSNKSKLGYKRVHLMAVRKQNVFAKGLFLFSHFVLSGLSVFWKVLSTFRVTLSLLVITRNATTAQPAVCFSNVL